MENITPPSEHKKWYVLRVISGKEKKIKAQIESEINFQKWDDIVTQVLVPTRKEFKLRNGKKIITERNFWPGYMLIEADSRKLNADIISAIAGTTNVIHFLGKNNPEFLRESEVNRILGKVDEMDEAGESMSEPFLVNETIKIIDGPFNDFNGNIEEVMEDKKKLRVIVKIFGRRTPVELDFTQVEKIGAS